MTIKTIVMTNKTKKYKTSVTQKIDNIFIYIKYFDKYKNAIDLWSYASFVFR